MAVAVAVDGAVGTGLGLKGSLQLVHLQTAMLQQVGQLQAPFQPESGAYGSIHGPIHGHSHSHDH